MYKSKAVGEPVGGHWGQGGEGQEALWVQRRALTLPSSSYPQTTPRHNDTLHPL